MLRVDTYSIVASVQDQIILGYFAVDYLPDKSMRSIVSILVVDIDVSSRPRSIRRDYAITYPLTILEEL
jgi:hypothetical protein